MSDGLGSQSNLLVCANGHRMIAGTTTCPQCGAKPSTLGNASPATAAGAAKSRRTSIILAAVVGAAVLLGVGAFAVVSLIGSDSQTPAPSIAPSTTAGVTDVCDEPGVPTLQVGDDDLTTTARTVCLVVTTQQELAVGAYPLGASEQDLSMDIHTVDGVYWAAADDTLTPDPEVVAVFEPDTYVVTISAFGTDELEQYAIYALSFGDIEPTIATPTIDVPSLGECGTDSVPLVTNNGNLPLVSETPFVCFDLTRDAFTKFGAQASGTVDGQPADLRVTVYEFVDGEPVFVRSADDYFFLDPELSLDLAAGNYLIGFDTWYEGPTGEFTAYFDSAGDFFRTVDASAPFAFLSADDCGPGGYPVVETGVTYTVPGADMPIVCLDLPREERVYITVTSLAEGEDLTLEVIGFETSTPQRWAWNDDSPDGAEVTDTDPALDVLLPAGTYALAMADFFGESEVTSFEVTVDIVD